MSRDIPHINKIATRMVEILAAENMTVRDAKTALYSALKIIDFGTVHAQLSCLEYPWGGKASEERLCNELRALREKANQFHLTQCEKCYTVFAAIDETCPNCGSCAKQTTVYKACTGTINEEALRNEIRKQREETPS